MKIFKKFLFLVLTIIMCSILFCGCAKQSELAVENEETIDPNLIIKDSFEGTPEPTDPNDATIEENDDNKAQNPSETTIIEETQNAKTEADAANDKKDGKNENETNSIAVIISDLFSFDEGNVL